MSEPLLPLTLEQQTQALANYLPTGRAFGAKNVSGSVTRKLLEGLAVEAGRADQLILDFLREILPDQTVEFLAEWERAVGIPDDCFLDTAGTLAERRRNVLAKLVALGVQTKVDFISLANMFGVACDVIGGSINGTFPYTFPMVFFGSSKEAKFTIIVNFTLPLALTFPYTFPIPFGTPELILVQCLFQHVKPANVNLLFVNL